MAYFWAAGPWGNSQRDLEIVGQVEVLIHRCLNVVVRISELFRSHVSVCFTPEKIL